MYLSCSTLCFDSETHPDIGEVLSRIRAMGFKAVDLAAFEDWQNVNPSFLLEDDGSWSDMLLETLEELDLRMNSINGGPSVAINDPDPARFVRYRQEVVALLDLAVKLGCPNLTLQPGRPIAGERVAELLDRTQAHLAELGPLAAARNVTLSVEGHQGSLLEKPDAAHRMMEALWPRVGFTYDPSHWAMQRIPLDETARLLPFTYNVHVRNAKPDAMQASTDDGVVDFAWLVEALRTSGYDGAVAIEYFNGFDADLEETAALRDRLLALGVDAVPGEER